MINDTVCKLVEDVNKCLIDPDLIAQHFLFGRNILHLDGWLVVLGLTALWDSISVYIGPSPKEREKEEKG